jgi:hypothetical protein
VAAWTPGLDVPESEKELELRKMFVAVSAAVTADAADDIKTSNSLLEYAEKKGYSDVTVEQLEELEEKIVKEAEQAAFAKDITEFVALPQPRDKGVLQSKIFTSRQLQQKEVFLNNEGLLRKVTRLDNADFPSPDEKRPLLLPLKHQLTQLLVREYHRQGTHSRPKTTFALLARRYSLLLSAVKNVTYKCQHCRERTPIPVKYSQAALHENRLQGWTYAFHDTGMDHFGPFEVQRAKKVCALLLICLTRGAIHCEPVDTLSINSHLNTLDRFVARQGKPRRICRDQGRTFVGGAKEHQELTKVLAEKSFQGQLAKDAKKRWGIEFVFNVEYTPHHGGRWERMVKEFKRIITKAVDSVARMKYDAFTTLLVRAEGIINQRPIAIDEDLWVITQMQLLQPASASTFGFKVGQSVLRINEQVRQSVEYFWKLWRTRYLTQHATERQTKGNARFFNLAVGDKVLLKDNFRTSNVFAKADWTQVRVTEIFPSGDGAVRTVTVQKKNGNEQTLTTDKLAIVDKDLLDRYRRQQGLQTVARDEDENIATLQRDEEEIPTTAGREILRASLQCDNGEDTMTAGHDRLLTTPENDEENPSTAGCEGLRGSLQCDTSGDRASPAHATPMT